MKTIEILANEIPVLGSIRADDGPVQHVRKGHWIGLTRAEPLHESDFACNATEDGIPGDGIRPHEDLFEMPGAVVKPRRYGEVMASRQARCEELLGPRERAPCLRDACLNRAIDTR